MKITSQPLTFLDTTDSRKLEVYISSNHPTTQLYNANNSSNKYTPDWSTTNLKLSADIFLDSEEITPQKKRWYRQSINEASETLISTGDYTDEITISANMTSAIVTYICRVEYQGLTAFSKITFTKTDAGINGTAGKDGTSVRILGTATAVAPVSNTDYYTITYSNSAITAAAIGDAYLYNGNLYVCAVIRDADDYFINVGNIQGPAGSNGVDAKLITLSSSSQVFKVSNAGTVTPTTITVTATAINTSVSAWTYSTDGGKTFSSTVPTGLSRNGNTVTITGSTLSVNSVVIKASDGTYGDTLTVHKVTDGTNGSKGDSASMAFLTNENISFAANSSGQISTTSLTTNIVAYRGTEKVMPTVGTPSGMPSGMTISVDSTSLASSSKEVMLTVSIANNSTLDSTSSNHGTITIPITSPVSTNLLLSWSKINTGTTGVGINSIQVKYGTTNSATQKPATESDWKIELPEVPEGHYLWTRTIIDYTDPNKADTVTYTYVKQGKQGAQGEPGTSVGVVKIQYRAHDSATIPPNSWVDAVEATSASKPYLWTRTTFSDGKYADSVARYGSDGAAGKGITSIKEQYYQSTLSTSQANGSWVDTVPTWVDGKYIWTRSVITYTDNTTYTTSPVCVTGQKGGTGVAGIGIASVDVWYYQSAYSTSLSGGSWSTTSPTWSDGKYIWTKTITTYTDSTTDETAAVCITGQKGSTGVGVKSVTEYYFATSSSSGVTLSTNGWTTAIQTITADKKYLWNYEVITYTNDTTSTTTPIIIGVFGNTGAAGKGIKSIKEYYLATTASTGVTTATNGWTEAMQTLTSTNKYLWNYESITYTDDSTSTINPVVIGVYGDKGVTGSAGADAYTVLLTNESHVFAGDTANAIASTATTQILAYKGTTAQTVTIVSVNGVTAATASTATGIAGLSFACSALSGTTPTITFTCTTSFVSQSGSIPIVLSVGGVSITKMFTYSIAFKGSTGATGGTGSAGAAATAYWLISDASVVQKSNSGTVVLTPSTLTFTGKSKTGTSAPANYACRWIIAYSTDGSTYTNSYTSSANEASKTFTVDSSYKSIRVRMYLAGGTSTLLDEQIIPVVADGAVGTPGMDAVTFQIYSSSGYALSASTPNVTLQTFAYVGDVAIAAGATYQWSKYSTSGWATISGATNAYLTISRDDVAFSQSYMCKMTFNGVEYTSVATIDDKNDNNKVFTTKPSNYTAGDIWIVGSDYAPSGVEVGTLLKAQYTNTSYADADWIKATKYDEQLKNIQDDIAQYNQYFSFNSTDGVKITAKDSSGAESKYSTTISNDKWAINYGSEAVTYVDETKMHIKEAEIESPLTITGKYSGSTMLQAPIMNIGNFSLVIESNGSLSVVVKS